MGGSSFLNAFRLLARKPALFLLLLPLQLALPLVGILLPAPFPTADSADIFGALGSSVAYSMNLIGIYLLLYLLAGFLLISPAMELLHDGALGAETPVSWYARGMRKHWWKPVSLGAMETVLFTAMGTVFTFALSFFAVVAAVGSFDASGADAGGAVPLGVSISTVVLIAAFALIVVFIYCLFAMLLPATADRGFGASFKAVFSGAGLKKTLKVFGVYILSVVAAAAVFAAFALAYALTSNMLTGQQADLNASLSGFLSSWMFYGAGVIVAFVTPFRYAYLFCAFHETGGTKPETLPETPVAGGEGESGAGL